MNFEVIAIVLIVGLLAGGLADFAMKSGGMAWSGTSLSVSPEASRVALSSG